MEFTEEQKNLLNKAFWAVALVLLGVWFYNESTTTKNTLRNESSIIFSNLMEQFKNLTTSSQIMANKDSDNSNSKLQEVAERFKTESSRLEKDFDGFTYSNLAKLIKASYNLTKGSQEGAEQLNDLTKLNADLSNKPLDVIEKELATLLKARILLASKEDPKIKEGQNILLNLAKESKLVSIDAIVSYILSFEDHHIEADKHADIKEIVKNRPEIKEDLSSEFSRFGINVEID